MCPLYHRLACVMILTCVMVLTHVLVLICVNPCFSVSPCLHKFSVSLFYVLNSRSFLSFTLLWSVHPEKNVVDPRHWPQTGCLCSIGLYFNPPHLLLKRMYILHKILIQCSTFSILAHVPLPACVEYIFPNLSEFAFKFEYGDGHDYFYIFTIRDTDHSCWNWVSKPEWVWRSNLFENSH